jgi:hypothetical protein
MAKWKLGQALYDTLIAGILENVTASCESFTIREAGHNQLVAFAKVTAIDFIGALAVKDLILIHEYFMYCTEMKPDPRFPTYVYTGGDRIAAVTRYIQKHMDLEMAKAYA